MDEERWRSIESRQLSSEEKARRADVVVENSGGKDTLREEARSLMQRLSGEAVAGGVEDQE